MSIENTLRQNSGSPCELCASTENLSSYEVEGHPAAQSDSHVFICEICLGQILQPETLNPNHWYCLKESMWSERAAVQVLCYRILQSLNQYAWAQDLLGQLYLDEENLQWAEAFKSTETIGAVKVLDSNGTELKEGDTVTLIKDLDVKGANFTAKRGTTVKNIALTDDPKLIEGRVNGTRIVLVAAYLKKA